jgi:hypothetical protein
MALAASSVTTSAASSASSVVSAVAQRAISPTAKWRAAAGASGEKAKVRTAPGTSLAVGTSTGRPTTSPCSRTTSATASGRPLLVTAPAG